MTPLRGIMLWEDSSQFGCLCHDSEENRDRASLGLQELFLTEMKLDL